jgi:hypothetical protein
MATYTTETDKELGEPHAECGPGPDGETDVVPRPDTGRAHSDERDEEVSEDRGADGGPEGETDREEGRTGRPGTGGVSEVR